MLCLFRGRCAAHFNMGFWTLRLSLLTAISAHHYFFSLLFSYNFPLFFSFQYLVRLLASVGTPGEVGSHLPTRPAFREGPESGGDQSPLYVPPVCWLWFRQRGSVWGPSRTAPFHVLRSSSRILTTLPP